MPITRRGGKYYWGSKGPFESRKKAEEVARAAHASGYQEDTMATVTGTTAGGATLRSSLQKEDGGGDSSGAGTVFTVDTSGYNETYNEHAHDDKKKRQKWKKSGIDRAYAFLVDGTPSLKSLDTFMQKDTPTTAADNMGSKNRMNNPRRLDWRKIKKESNMSANRIPSEEDPSHANQPVPRKKSKEEERGYIDESQKKLVVNANKGNPNLKQPDEHKIAQQKDMEERAKVWDKERKKKGDDQEGPPLEQGAAASQDLHMMVKEFAGGYSPDALARGGDKDKIGRRDDEKEPEEEDKLEVLKQLAPNLYKMFDFSDVP